MTATMTQANSLAAMRARIGEEVGVSGWHQVTQDEIDRFADLTGDHQFIHVDPVRAKSETPYGGTIAHGFFVLSLLPKLRNEVLAPIQEQAVSLNYGLDRLRFLAPVRSGARVRARFELREITMRKENEALFRFLVTVEIEHESKPALVAESLGLVILK